MPQTPTFQIDIDNVGKDVVLIEEVGDAASGGSRLVVDAGALTD